MNFHNKIILLLLFITRTFDMISTYFAGKGSLYGETNFLVKDLNLGWFSLGFSNAIFIFISYLLLKFQTEKYYISAENRLKSLSIESLNFKKYFCQIYYRKEVTILEFFFSAKVSYKVLFNSLIHTFLITIIFGGIIISINNILNSKKLLNLFSYENQFYQNHMTKFLNLFIYIIVNYFYHKYRFKKYLIANSI